jgi:hypothetical protein
MLGIDGIEPRRFTQHSCQLGLIRCSDAGVDMLGKAENSMPIMAIPGPRQPTKHQWAAIITLLVSVFTRCSPGVQCAAPSVAAYKLWLYKRFCLHPWLYIPAGSPTNLRKYHKFSLQRFGKAGTPATPPFSRAGCAVVFIDTLGLNRLSTQI